MSHTELHFLARVDIDAYRMRPALQALDSESYQTFREELHQFALPETQAELDRWYNANDIMIDAKAFNLLRDLGINVNLKRIKGLASPGMNPLPQVINQISVSNVGLMQIRWVQVLEDACTDELQSKLDGGWRILAVCPPNDTRRPTYILGSFEQRRTEDNLKAV